MSRLWLALLALASGALLTAAPVRAQSGSGVDPSAPTPRERSGVPGSMMPTSDPAGSGSGPGLGENPGDTPLPVSKPTPSLAGAVDAATYRVGPGDVMQLLLWGKVSKVLVLEVGPEGHILLPGVGTMRVENRTLADVKQEVLSRMGREFRGVSMDFRLVRPRLFRIYLTGQVKSPGPLDAVGSQRVADVLTPNQFQDDGSRRRVELIHRDGSREPADLDLFLRSGNSIANPALRDGDIINVPVATDFIYAAGAVARPGRVELGRADSLLTLFRLAGDPLPSADAERALLVRFTRPFQPESLWFGLEDVYAGRVNPPLRDGDRLYVYYIPQYHLQHEASVVGEVARPGVYPIVEGRHHLSDLIAAAGGFLPGADLSAIRVNRRNSNAGEKDPELDRLLRLSRNELTSTEYEVLRTRLSSLKEDFRLDWNRMLADKQDLDVLLRDGDLVRVERLVSSIRIDGEVLRPGILSYRQGLTVEDYVLQAGGYANRAWKGRVRVTRSVTGQTLLAKNVHSLDPGDVIWVPEKPDSNYGQNAQTLLVFGAQIATIVLAIVTLQHF